MSNTYRQWSLSTLAFVATFTLHYLWIGLFPEQDPAQSGWALMPVETPWLQLYLEGQHYWLGYSYALCLAFVSYALIYYWQTHNKTTGRAAIGGLGLSGVLALAGCFLIGCCGSPMLIVWLNLFGAAFLPFAKPLMALVTTISVVGAWFWFQRKVSFAHTKRNGCC